MIRPITFEEQIVGSKTDGGVYRNIYPYDGILWGCGVTTTNTQIEIASGLFVLCGRLIWVDGKTVFPMEDPIQNGYARLKAQIDLNAPSTQEECGQFSTAVEFSTTTLFPELTQEDINNAGKVYEQELAVVKIEAGNITGVTRKMENAEIDAERLNGKYENQLRVAQAVDAITLGGKAESQLSVSNTVKMNNKWESSLSVAQAATLPVATATAFTFPTGVAPFIGLARKYGRMVYLELTVNSNSDTIPSGGLVAAFTEPSGFVPASDVSVNGIAKNMRGEIRLAKITIKTNGQIIYTCMAESVSAKEVTVSAAYYV